MAATAPVMEKSIGEGNEEPSCPIVHIPSASEDGSKVEKSDVAEQRRKLAIVRKLRCCLKISYMFSKRECES